MPPETPLKFPDLPADHPANQETPPVQTDVPVSSEASAETPPSTASSNTPESEQSPSSPESSPTEPPTDSASETPTDSGSTGDSSPPSTEPSPPSTTAAEAAPSGVAFDGSVYRARSDNDVLTNTFCKVIAGPYTGRYGVYITTASLGADGWPAEVVVRTRDAEDENIVVAYADIRPDVAGRR